jgi:hypothetical protein
VDNAIQDHAEAAGASPVGRVSLSAMSAAAIDQAVVSVLILGWVLYRQLQARPLVADRVLVLPAVMIVIGAIELGNLKGGISSSDAGWLGIDLLASVVLGVARAQSVRVYAHDGVVWRQGSVVTAGLWLVSVLVRIVVALIARHHGAGKAVDEGLLLSFGVTLAVQYVLLMWRARDLGVPFARSRPRSA